MSAQQNRRTVIDGEKVTYNHLQPSKKRAERALVSSLGGRTRCSSCSLSIILCLATWSAGIAMPI